MGHSYYVSGRGYDPSPKMLALLQKLIELKGAAVYQSRLPKGFVVKKWNDAGDTFWFPTIVGLNAWRRGLIDDQGFITDYGIRALDICGNRGPK